MLCAFIYLLCAIFVLVFILNISINLTNMSHIEPHILICLFCLKCFEYGTMIMVWWRWRRLPNDPSHAPIKKQSNLIEKKCLLYVVSLICASPAHPPNTIRQHLTAQTWAPYAVVVFCTAKQLKQDFPFNNNYFNRCAPINDAPFISNEQITNQHIVTQKTVPQNHIATENARSNHFQRKYLHIYSLSKHRNCSATCKRFRIRMHFVYIPLTIRQSRNWSAKYVNYAFIFSNCWRFLLFIHFSYETKSFYWLVVEIRNIYTYIYLYGGKYMYHLSVSISSLVRMFEWEFKWKCDNEKVQKVATPATFVVSFTNYGD